ncbi:MAG: hypothetical protein ABFE07_16255 [Armatimonadia bacterium]
MRSKTIKVVDCGWSLAGHWYVHFSTGDHRGGDVYVTCKSKAQAKAIAHALGKIAARTVDHA